MEILTVKPSAVEVGVPKVGVFAAPIGVMLWVAEVKEPEVKVSV